MVCALVPLGKPRLFVGERVDTMFVHLPVERSTWHAQEPCAIRVVSLEAATTPKRRRSRCHELLVVEHTAATGPLTAMLKSPPTKSTSSRAMCAWSRCKSEEVASRFLATTLWKVSQQGGLRSRPRTTRAVRLQVLSPMDSSVNGNLTLSGRNVQTFAICVGVELGCDVWDVITGLLEKHRVEGAAVDRSCVGRRRVPPGFHCGSDPCHMHHLISRCVGTFRFGRSPGG